MVFHRHVRIVFFSSQPIGMFKISPIVKVMDGQLDKTVAIDRFHSRDRWPQWGGETIRNI